MVGHLQANKARKAVKSFSMLFTGWDFIDLSRNDWNEYPCEPGTATSLSSFLIQVDLGKRSY